MEFLEAQKMVARWIMHQLQFIFQTKISQINVCLSIQVTYNDCLPGPVDKAPNNVITVCMAYYYILSMNFAWAVQKITEFLTTASQVWDPLSPL